MFFVASTHCPFLTQLRHWKMAKNTTLGRIKQKFQEFENSSQVMINDLRLLCSRN